MLFFGQIMLSTELMPKQIHLSSVPEHIANEGQEKQWERARGASIMGAFPITQEIRGITRQSLHVTAS